MTEKDVLEQLEAKQKVITGEILEHQDEIAKARKRLKEIGKLRKVLIKAFPQATMTEAV
jgi:hypothetical protein